MQVLMGKGDNSLAVTFEFGTGLSLGQHKRMQDKIYHSKSDCNDYLLVLQSQECLTMLNGFCYLSIVFSM